MITIADNEYGPYNGTNAEPASASNPIRIVGVRVPTPELQARFNEWWRPEYSDSFHPHNVIGDGGTLRQWLTERPDAPPKLGTLCWPTGLQRWATFYALVTKSELDTFAFWDSEGSDGLSFLRIDDGTRFIQARMRRLPARPLWATDDDHQLWLLPLVDKRWEWHQLRADVGGPGVADAVGDDAATWVEMLERVAVIYGIGPSDGISNRLVGSTPDADYLTPEKSRWRSGGVTSRLSGSTFAEFHEAATAAIQCRSLYIAGLTYGTTTTPATLDAGTAFFSTASTDSGIALRTAANARTDADANWTSWSGHVRTGGQMPLTQLGNALPQNVRVMFGGPSTTGRYAEVAYSALTITGTDDLEPLIDNYAYIESELDATVDSSDRDDWAEQAAEDWYTWRIADRVDAVFNGVVPWKPTGAESAIEWSTSTDPLDMTTRVITHAHASMQTLRGDDASHAAFVQVQTPDYSGSTSAVFGLEAGKVVDWVPSTSDDTVRDEGAQGDYAERDLVAISVPGEFPAEGHVYLAVKQSNAKLVDDDGGYDSEQANVRAWYVGAPRGYALAKLTSRINTTEYYEATGYIPDGTNFRNIGSIYVACRGSFHDGLIVGNATGFANAIDSSTLLYHVQESGRYTSGNTTLRLYTYEGGATKSLNNTAEIDPTFSGAPVVADQITGISLNTVESPTGTFTVTAIVSYDRKTWHFGISPHGFVNSITVSSSGGNVSANTAFVTHTH